MIITKPEISSESANPIPAAPPLATIEKFVPRTPFAVLYELCCDLLKLGCLALALSMVSSALFAVGMF